MTIFHESFLNIISLFRNTPYRFEKMCEFAKYKSSHLICSIKKVVLKNSQKFTGKHLYWSLLLSKVAGLLPVEPNHLFCFPKQMTGFYVKQACNLIKNETSTQVFSCQFCEIVKDNSFYRKSPVDPSFNKIYWPESRNKNAEHFNSMPAQLGTHHGLLWLLVDLKSSQIQSFFLSVFSCIRTEYGDLVFTQ